MNDFDIENWNDNERTNYDNDDDIHVDLGDFDSNINIILYVFKQNCTYSVKRYIIGGTILYIFLNIEN